MQQVYGGMVMGKVQIRQMKEEDIDIVYQVFTKDKIIKPFDYIVSCWDENKTGERITLMAFSDQEFVGSLHLLKNSSYPFFKENGIPEINDFNVVSNRRGQGIGNELMEEVEKLAFETYSHLGIGVGLYADYGRAQRLYTKRAYILDRRGIMYNNEPVAPGSHVRVDDELVLYFTKSR